MFISKKKFLIYLLQQKYYDIINSNLKMANIRENTIILYLKKMNNQKPDISL